MDYAQVAPLPVGFYFHPAFHAFREKMNKGGAHYVGHVSMVPRPGDYYVMSQYGNHDYVLVHGKDGKFRLISNVCRHRGARMLPHKDTDPLHGNLRSGNVICPIHFFSYDACDGHNVRAPEFSTEMQQRVPALPTKELQVVHGMLFDTTEDVSGMASGIAEAHPELDMRDYIFAGKRDVVPYKFSLEKFMEVYQDVRHVVPFHRTTFVSIVDCETLDWEFGDGWSIQRVSYNESGLGVAGPEYADVRELIARLPGREPKYGALWVAAYPGLMIEWYPHVLVVSMLVHTGVDSCVNVVDYFVHKDLLPYKDDIMKFAPRGYDASAGEDAVICEREQEGLKSMWETGHHCAGLFHPHEELGVGHYFHYIREKHKRIHESDISDKLKKS